MPETIPIKYPPEVPAIIAGKIRGSSGIESFKTGFVLGAGIPCEVVAVLSSRKNTLEVAKEIEEMGYFIYDREEKSPAVCYSCFASEFENAIEVISTALHAFKRLNVSRVLIIDVVRPLVEMRDEIVRIDDYINMSGVNPLDYWMMLKGPEEFFLDPKELLSGEGLEEFKSGIHLCAKPDLSSEIIGNAVQSGASTISEFIVPELLITGYLGIKPSVLAITDIEKIGAEKLKIILNSIDDF